MVIYEDYDRKINFSKVETFEFKKEKLDDDWIHYNENLYLYLDIKERKQAYISGFYCAPENVEKVLKALNHLRKLCGAPEPINFN